VLCVDYVITYHHMRESDIREMWDFEQKWGQKGREVMLYRDVFRKYVVPRLAARIDGWDNLAVDPAPGDAGSLEECEVVCEARPDCLQYLYAGGKCSTSTEIRHGNAAESSCAEYSITASKCVRWSDESRSGSSVQPGWMIARLSRYMEEMNTLRRENENAMWVG
jgi:hypothetical protein